jgi:hypothetical protein
LGPDSDASSKRKRSRDRKDSGTSSIGQNTEVSHKNSDRDSVVSAGRKSLSGQTSDTFSTRKSPQDVDGKASFIKKKSVQELHVKNPCQGLLTSSKRKDTQEILKDDTELTSSPRAKRKRPEDLKSTDEAENHDQTAATHAQSTTEEQVLTSMEDSVVVPPQLEAVSPLDTAAMPTTPEDSSVRNAIVLVPVSGPSNDEEDEEDDDAFNDACDFMPVVGRRAGSQERQEPAPEILDFSYDSSDCGGGENFGRLGSAGEDTDGPAVAEERENLPERPATPVLATTQVPTTPSVTPVATTQEAATRSPSPQPRLMLDIQKQPNLQLKSILKKPKGERRPSGEKSSRSQSREKDGDDGRVLDDMPPHLLQLERDISR